MKPKIVFLTNRMSPVAAALAAAENLYVAGILHMMLNCSPSEQLWRLARENDICYHTAAKLDATVRDWISTLHVDFIVVYSLHHILKQEILAIPRRGSINLHPSFLPNYRGPNPWQEQWNGHEQLGGMTVHRINEQVDAGPILLQCAFPINRGVAFEAFVESSLRQYGAPLLLQALEHFDSLLRI